MRLYTFAFLSLFALTLLLGGCAVRPTAVEPLLPEVRDELLPMLRNRTLYWSRYTAQVRINAESTKGKFRRVQAVALAAPPDHFRLEAFSLWGQTVGAIAADESGSSLWIPSEKVVFSAGRAETLIEQFIGVPIPIETLLYSLAATIPHDQLDGIRIEESKSGWVARAKDNKRNWSFAWEISRKPLALQSLQVREGPWSYKISYDPPVGLGPQQSPKRISFVSSQWKMEVAVDRMAASPDLQASSFRKGFPADIRTIDLDSVQWKANNP